MPLNPYAKFVSDYARLIDEAKIFPLDTRTNKIGESVGSIALPEGGLVASYRHLVVVQG